MGFSANTMKRKQTNVDNSNSPENKDKFCSLAVSTYTQGTNTKRERQNILKEKRKKKLMGLISNLFLSKRFIKILKTLTAIRTPKFLASRNFTIINDLTFFYDIWKKSQMIVGGYQIAEKFNCLLGEKFIRKMQTIAKKLIVFDTSSSFIAIWSIIQVMLILFFFFIIPLEKSFNFRFSEEFAEFSFIEMSALVLFSADVAVSLNTAVYIKGRLRKERSKIFENYLRTHCLRDSLSILSILARIYLKKINWGFEFFEWFFFLRLFNLSTIIKQLESLFLIDHSVHNVLALIKLMARIILLSHIFSCLWNFVGNISPDESWIQHQGLIGHPWWVLYINSYYYVCITMNTVGYGDITPQNIYEKVFAIIFTYMACGVFAYTLNSVGLIVGDIARRDSELQRGLTTLNGFMKQKKISKDLRVRVAKYLEYISEEDSLQQLEEQGRVIGELSEVLKKDLMIEANSPILRHLKMFTKNFSEHFLRELMPLIKEARFTAGDRIFSSGEWNDVSLFIVRKGELEIFQELWESKTVIKTLKIGETFGEIAFFSGQSYDYSVRSIDFTSLYVISRENFIELLKKHPEDLEKFCQIRDNINIYENYKELFLKCLVCNTTEHVLHQCPNLFYRPKKEILVLKHFFSSPQDRNEKFKRKTKAICLRARLNIREIQEQIEELQEEMNSEPSEINKTNERQEPESSDLKGMNLVQTVSYHGSEVFKNEEIENEDPVDSNPNQCKVESLQEITSGKLLKRGGGTCAKADDQEDSDLAHPLLMNYSRNLTNDNKLKININGVTEKKNRKEKQACMKEELMKQASVMSREKNPSTNIMIGSHRPPEIPTNVQPEDGVKSWDCYFPHNNCPRVIERLNDLLNLKRRRKNRKSSVFSSSPLKKRRSVKIQQDAKTANHSSCKSDRKSYFTNGQSLKDSKDFDIKKFKLFYREVIEKNIPGGKWINLLRKKIAAKKGNN